MQILDRYDVVIAGGGLAGLTLALHLRRSEPDAKILVAERNRHPLPEAAHKVGESSVEIGSHYFDNVLGLSDLLGGELRKFGLRFFMSHGGNRDITTRPECGPSHFLHVPSYQIDRGRFETKLAIELGARGVDFLDRCSVTDISLGSFGEDHQLRLERESLGLEISCRWIVDGTGRSSILKKQLGLTRSSRHTANAVWFRIDHPIDLDDWSDDRAWRGRNRHSRRLSTNHLMGEGYWVWLIPLAGGRTSVGIVAEERLHPFHGLRTFDAALKWLELHEPQCGEVVRSLAGKRMDFLGLRNYALEAKQVFSRDRWCLIGDAGFFIDPLYSPGSDFIGIGNGFCSDLIARDLDGEDVNELAAVYDESYRSLARTFLLIYHRQYGVMGSARVMVSKVIWDFVMYWGGVALIFFRNRMDVPDFMRRVRPLLHGFAKENTAMQALFRERSAAGDEEPPPGAFIDYAKLPFLENLNRRLLEDCDDDALVAQLQRNLDLARELRVEITAAYGQAERAPTSHLAGVFAAMEAAPPC